MASLVSKRAWTSFALVAVLAPAALASPPFETIFLPSRKLKIEAYLYRPPGTGPFPALIYNHGSRPGFEREERPMAYIAELFVPAGYVVLIVERRGYGKSDGETFSQEVGANRGAKYVSRLLAESDDVAASADYLETQSFIDPRRVAVMGWSFGGIVTVLASSRRTGFRAAINQAAGALSWANSPALQVLLRQSAGQMQAPLLTMVAENDATTAAAKAIDGAIRKTTRHRLIVYPPFHASSSPGVPEGHMLFSAAGIAVWKDDALAWLSSNMAGGTR